MEDINNNPRKIMDSEREEELKRRLSQPEREESVKRKLSGLEPTTQCSCAARTISSSSSSSSSCGGGFRTSQNCRQIVHRRRRYSLNCWSTIRMVLVIISVIFINSQLCDAAIAFKDTRQASFASSLSSYAVIIPSKVHENGDFLTHHLPHSVHPQHRRRRWAERSRQNDDAQTNAENIHYKLQTSDDGEELVLSLAPNHKLLAPGMIVERRVSQFGNLSDVRISRRPEGSICHYVGHVKGHQGSKVALETCNGLHGFIRTSHDEYFIEPVKGHEHSSTGHPHLVYKRSALPAHLDNAPAGKDEQRDHGTCGVDGEAESPEKQRERFEKYNPIKREKRSASSSSSSHRRKRSISLERNVEAMVVVDKDMMEYYQNEDIETYVLTIMNMVASMYHDSTIGNAVNIVLVRMMLLEENQKDLVITHHADNSLSSFCKWQHTINTKDDKNAQHHDVAILLTRKNICARMNEPCSTLGLAQVSGLCQPHRSCNINEDTGLSLAYTVSHELGHNFGMQHDGANNGCDANPQEHMHIMAPQLNARPSPVYWSNCSRDAITRFLDRDWGYCTDDEPSDHEYVFPDLPPGVMYDVDHQCRLQFGPDAKYCKGIDEPCSTLWCKVNNRCRTKLEASAQGTLCGENKWCYNNKCEMIMESPESIDGEWGVWGEWTSCSRSCGAGVMYKQRHCENPPPSKGGNYCLGERKRYRICNTDKCPPNEPSFKGVQCSSFDKVKYKGKAHEWEPVHTPATPCQLHCKPKGKFFSVMLRDTVIDGTPSRATGRDMCIGGRPRHIGCDWKIDSDAREDHCGICHGDGTSCKTVSEQYNKSTGLGYEDAMTIPAGARNIRVEEVAEANNYLAVRNTKGQYYLNGHWFIQWSGDYEAAGTIIHYKRDGNKESFEAPGPLKEPLQIMLLFQSQNPGVTFEYTIPNENMTDIRVPEYHWKYMDWTHCTSSCGGGTQRSDLVCVEKEAGIVENQYCNASLKQDDMMRHCNTHRCPARWWAGPWQHCSRTCGDLGLHRRTVICVRSMGPDNQIALDDADCEDLNKPHRLEPCRHKEPCVTEPAEWKVGEWYAQCSGDPCDTQMRRVTCGDDKDDNVKACDAEVMPPSERKCTNITCGTWQAREWSRCTVSCGGGIQFRSVMCIGGQACLAEAEPISQQDCNVQHCNSMAPPNDERKYAHMYRDSGSSNDTATEQEQETSDEGTSDEEQDAPRGEMIVTIDTTPAPENVHTQKKDKKVAVPVGRIVKSESEASTTSQIPVTTTTPEAQTTIAGVEETTTTHEIELATPSPHHKWIPLFWQECSVSCGGGIRQRDIMCINTRTLEEDGEELCAGHNRPVTEKPCNTDTPCAAWKTGEWSQCSSSCGKGSRTRPVTCGSEQEGECELSSRPHQIEPCEAVQSCSMWQEGPWSMCSVSCDSGQQVRHVPCVDVITLEPAHDCPAETKPVTTQKCTAEKTCEQSNNQALSGKSICRTNILSHHVCKTLKRMGRCRQKVVQFKCCRTCYKQARLQRHNKSSAQYQT